MSDARVVLVKPGDVLMIGNLGPLTPEDIDHLHTGLATVKESLRLAGVALFEGDIDLAAVAACDLTTGLSTRGGHSG